MFPPFTRCVDSVSNDYLAVIYTLLKLSDTYFFQFYDICLSYALVVGPMRFWGSKCSTRCLAIFRKCPAMPHVIIYTRVEKARAYRPEDNTNGVGPLDYGAPVVRAPGCWCPFL